MAIEFLLYFESPCPSGMAGLGRLKYYCQLCQRQCSDENGLKCHLSSATHRRRQDAYDADPNAFIEAYSRAFQKDFLSILNAQWSGGKRVLANTVYQSHIANRNHIRMNSTKWKSLTEFIRHLHASKLIRAEEIAPKDGDEDFQIYITSMSDISSVHERIRPKMLPPQHKESSLEHLALERAKLYHSSPMEEKKKSPSITPELKPVSMNDGPKISFKLCKPEKPIKFV